MYIFMYLKIYEYLRFEAKYFEVWEINKKILKVKNLVPWEL